MAKAIYFDLDGTLADLYGVKGWLADLEAHRTRPYDEARVMHNMSTLAKRIHKAQKNGIKVGIISWLSKTATEDYNKAVKKAKLKWLKKHLKSVTFDEIFIVPYGTPKHTLVAPDSDLFDDELRNRKEWNKGKAYPPEKIFEILKKFS